MSDDRANQRAASDEDLMAAYRDGDPEAFEELYRRYSGRVYGFVSSRLRREEERSEVYQNVFLKLHRGRGGYIQTLPFKAWLFAIARNALIDHCRREDRRREELGLAEDEARAVAPAESGSRARELFGAECLSERDRAVLTMHYLEGVPFDQVSARLGISHAAGRQIASRAVRKLKSLFGGKAGI